MESFIRFNGDKHEQYNHLIDQVASMLKHEQNLIANMANVCALIKTHLIGIG